MQIEQSTRPLVREKEWLSEVKKNNCQSASCLIISAPASQFHVDDNNAFETNEILCLVLAQTPDTSKFTFEQLEGRILVNSLLSATLSPYSIIYGKAFFELVFDVNTRGMILYNRSQYDQIVTSLSGVDVEYSIMPENFSKVLPPGSWELRTGKFQLRMKILGDGECDVVNEAIQQGEKRKRDTESRNYLGSPRARIDGPSKYRKVSQLYYPSPFDGSLKVTRVIEMSLWVSHYSSSNLFSQVSQLKIPNPVLVTLTSYSDSNNHQKYEFPEWQGPPPTQSHRYN